MSDDALTWVFAYGSLVSPASLASTIGRTVLPGDGMHVAELCGWGRRWNYGSAVLRGDWSCDGVDVVGGLVVSLGVTVAPGESINGVIFGVDGVELADLDWRERAYDRVDVTDAIRLLDHDDRTGPGSDEPVVVYVPRSDAIARYEHHRDAGTAAVRRWYRDLVERAFADLGAEHLDWYRQTPPPDVPIADVHLDPLPSVRPSAREPHVGAGPDSAPSAEIRA